MVQKGRGHIHKAFLTDSCFSTTGLSLHLYFTQQLSFTLNLLILYIYIKLCLFTVVWNESALGLKWIQKQPFYYCCPHQSVWMRTCSILFTWKTSGAFLVPHTPSVLTHSPKYGSRMSAPVQLVFLVGRDLVWSAFIFSVSKYKYQIISAQIKAHTWIQQ